MKLNMEKSCISHFHVRSQLAIAYHFFHIGKESESCQQPTSAFGLHVGNAGEAQLMILQNFDLRAILNIENCSGPPKVSIRCWHI